MHFLKFSSLAFVVLQFTLAGSLTGCAARLKNAATGSLVSAVAAATGKHDDIALVTQALPTFLLLVEGLLESSPNDPQRLLQAAELYTAYGSLIEADDPERARRIYHRAKTYSLKALAQNHKIRPHLNAPYSDFSQLIYHLKASDVPLVFWAASSWGAWISANTGSMATLADLPKVILLMEWVLATDETFYYGSPHVFLGIYHAALPQSLGGNPEKSLEHFNKALEINQDQSLMVYVQMARFYARRIFDRQLYESLLQKVLKMPIDQNPALTLQNATAQKMAIKYLEETDAYF